MCCSLNCFHIKKKWKSVSNKSRQHIIFRHFILTEDPEYNINPVWFALADKAEVKHGNANNLIIKICILFSNLLFSKVVSNIILYYRYSECTVIEMKNKKRILFNCSIKMNAFQIFPSKIIIHLLQNQCPPNVIKTWRSTATQAFNKIIYSVQFW